MKARGGRSGGERGRLGGAAVGATSLGRRGGSAVCATSPRRLGGSVVCAPSPRRLGGSAVASVAQASLASVGGVRWSGGNPLGATTRLVRPPPIRCRLRSSSDGKVCRDGKHAGRKTCRGAPGTISGLLESVWVAARPQVDPGPSRRPSRWLSERAAAPGEICPDSGHFLPRATEVTRPSP